MRRSWLIALSVHAAVLFGLSRLPIRVAAPPPAPSEELPVEIVPEHQGSVAAPEPGSVGAGASPARAHIASVIVAPSASVPAPSPTPGTETEDAAPTADGVVTLPQMTNGTPAIGFGASGVNPFLPKSEAAVALAESKRGVDRAMKDPARERETSLGLGPEGPVLTALSEATARSTAPVRGKAIFVATADENGVYTIELHDAEGSRAGWDDARNIALAALKGKKLRLPAGATRAVMRIEVASGWKLPGGQDPGTNVNLFHVPIGKGETKDSPTVNLLDPIPKLRVTEYQISKDVKVPIVSLEIDLFSTNADPTNLGAKPRRVVHSRLVDSQVM